jgi:hypothetical protein
MSDQTSTTPRLGHPHLGFGVGLRHTHFPFLLKHQPPVDWFEIISENFMDSCGKPRYVLDQIAERYPVVMHGVSLSIGSTDPINFDYLQRLKTLADAIQAHWVSDHLCWTGVTSRNSHDLLPIPLNEESLRHVIKRIRIVQDYLERPLVLENPSSYVTFAASTITEWDYLRLMAEEADCGLLLDVNNVFVSSVNHDFDPHEYIRSVPHDRIVQFHLAGHTNLGTHCIDTHDGKVIDDVWDLYRQASSYTDGVSTLIEWDANIPSFGEVHAEVLKAKALLAGTADNSAPVSAEEKPASVRPSVPHPLHLIASEVE